MRPSWGRDRPFAANHARAPRSELSWMSPWGWVAVVIGVLGSPGRWPGVVCGEQPWPAPAPPPTGQSVVPGGGTWPATRKGHPGSMPASHRRERSFQAGWAGFEPAPLRPREPARPEDGDPRDGEATGSGPKLL